MDCAHDERINSDTVTYDFDAFCAQADNLAAELLAALEDLCKDLDESLYNGCTNPLVFENETLEVSDDDDSEGTRSATAL